MVYRLPGERVSLDLEGPSVEVERLVAWPIFWTASRLTAAALADEPDDDDLRRLYLYFEAEAQPAWDIEDHRGRIPATAAGMLRLPVPLALEIVLGWLETHTPKPTAADAVLPPGPVRDAVNERLRSKR